MKGKIMITAEKIILAILFLGTAAIAQTTKDTPSWRHMLIPEVQEITDRIIELRFNYERGKERLPIESLTEEDLFYLGPPLLSESERIEAIARHVTDRVLQEYNERKKTLSRASPECVRSGCTPLTEKDLADMMYCRFNQSLGKCPRPEFLIARRAR